MVVYGTLYDVIMYIQNNKNYKNNNNNNNI